MVFVCRRCGSPKRCASSTGGLEASDRTPAAPLLEATAGFEKRHAVVASAPRAKAEGTEDGAQGVEIPRSWTRLHRRARSDPKPGAGASLRAELRGKARAKPTSGIARTDGRPPIRRRGERSEVFGSGLLAEDSSGDRVELAHRDRDRGHPGWVMIAPSRARSEPIGTRLVLDGKVTEDCAPAAH